MLLYLMHGVTSLRCAGDVDGTADNAAITGLENGALAGPRIFSSGPFIGAKEARWPNTLFVESPEDAPGAVARLKSEGATNIKLYEHLDEPTIRALTAAAKDAGLGVFGHVPDTLDYDAALVPDVQHFQGIARTREGGSADLLTRSVDWRSVDEERLDEIVKISIAHGIANTPTLVSLNQLRCYEHFEATISDPVLGLLPGFYVNVVWHPVKGIPAYRGLTAEFFEQRADTFTKKLLLVRKLHDAGAALRLGTDTLQPFVVAGAAVHQEMELFADAGIPAESIWKYGTIDSGRALGPQGLGTLDDGAPADFLIFHDDPTASLDALQSLRAVVVRGQLYTMESLQAKQAEYQAFYNAFPLKQLSALLAQRAVDQAAANT